MTPRASLVSGRWRRRRSAVVSLWTLFGREGLTYTQKTGVAVGIAGALRVRGPWGQSTGKRGGTDV